MIQVTKETAELAEGNGGGGGDDIADVGEALNATAGGDGETGDDSDEDDGVEFVGMADNVSYLAPVLRVFALLHTFAAIAMTIGYYYLKVRDYGSSQPNSQLAADLYSGSGL